MTQNLSEREKIPRIFCRKRKKIVNFDKKLRRAEKIGLFFTELLDFPPDSVIIVRNEEYLPAGSFRRPRRLCHRIHFLMRKKGGNRR